MLVRIVEFLLGAIADILAFLFIARLLMQMARVSFVNPIGEFIIATTSWAVRPLRRVLPPVARVDSASLVAAWLVQLLPIIVTLLLRGAELPGAVWLSVLWFAFVDTLRIVVWVLVIALIAAALISWLNPRSALAAPINQLTRPLLRPVQRVVPPISGIDLSPLVVILLLQVVLIVLDSLK